MTTFFASRLRHSSRGLRKDPTPLSSSSLCSICSNKITTTWPSIRLPSYHFIIFFFYNVMPTFFTETTRSMRSVRSSTRTTCSSSTELFPSSPCCIQNGKENMQMLCTHQICCRCRSNRQRHGVRSSVRREPEVSLWSRWCCAGAAGSECLASNLRQPGCPARCLSHPVGEELGGDNKKTNKHMITVISDYCPPCGGHKWSSGPFKYKSPHVYAFI